MTRAAAAAAACCVLLPLAGPLPAAAGKPPAARIAVLSKSASGLAKGERLRLRVRFGRSGKVRLFARIARRGRRPLRLAVGKLVGFRRPGVKRVSLRVTRPARRLLRRRLRSCRPALMSVGARARVYRRRLRGRPLLSPGNRSRRSRTTRRRLRLRAPRGCRPPARPGPAAGPRPPAQGGSGGGPPPGGAGSAPLSAGAAASDITPPVGTPMFAYTARSGLANPPRALQIVADPDENLYAKSFEPSDGIHTRVQSRALVLERRGVRFALVQVDLGGIPYALVQEVERRLAGTGIDGERLLISATHTHSSTGPIWPADNMGYGALGGDLFDPRIFGLTAEGIAESVRSAAARLGPARVGIGSAELRTASRNRNFAPFRRNADVPRDEGAARAASIDPRLTAVRVDTPGGRPIALWSNFAVHQTSFGDENLLFSGDNAATAVRLADEAIARERGGRPLTVWSNAAEGDISPNGDPESPDGEPLEWVKGDAAKANLAGRRLGQGIVAAWRDAGSRMASDLPLGARRSFLPFDGTRAEGEPVGLRTVLGAGGIVADDGFCGPDDTVTGQGRKFPALEAPGPPPLPATLVPKVAPVSLWRIGPLGIAAYPSEITRWMGKRIADRVRAESRGALGSVAIAGLTNGYLSYTATPEEYDACHYEGSFTLFGRRQGPRYVDGSLPLVRPLLDGGPAPPGAPEPLPTGIGTADTAPLEPTPDAGQAVTQPATSVSRHGRVSFSWKGGDPAVDAPRGRPFVRLERQLAGGRWATVATEDGPSDITVWSDPDKAWTETWQFGTCDPPGRYRFRVEGRSDAEGRPYGVSSRPFDLRPLSGIELIDATVAGGSARVRARYPDPGPALLALPRRVRDGHALLVIRKHDGTTDEIRAAPDAQRLAFTAEVPEGSTIEAVRVEDGCGNSRS